MNGETLASCVPEDVIVLPTINKMHSIGMLSLLTEVSYFATWYYNNCVFLYPANVKYVNTAMHLLPQVRVFKFLHHFLTDIQSLEVWGFNWWNRIGK